MADEVTNYSLHRYHTTNQFGQDVMHVSGVANIEVKNPRTDTNWHGFEVDIKLDTEKWEGDFEVHVPSVSLASISNDHEAVFAGWAADDAKHHEILDIPYIRAKLAVKDTDGRLHRVSFTAIVVGKKVLTNSYPGLVTLPTHVLQKALDYKMNQAK